MTTADIAELPQTAASRRDTLLPLRPGDPEYADVCEAIGLLRRAAKSLDQRIFGQPAYRLLRWDCIVLGRLHAAQLNAGLTVDGDVRP